MQDPRDAALEHDRRGHVVAPRERVAERAAAGLAVPHEQRAAAAQQLALDHGVVERGGGLAQARQRRGGRVGAVAHVQRLRDERLVLHAAEQDAVQAERLGRVPRRLVDDLAHRAELREPGDRRAHALERVQARDGVRRRSPGHAPPAASGKPAASRVPACRISSR